MPRTPVKKTIQIVYWCSEYVRGCSGGEPVPKRQQNAAPTRRASYSPWGSSVATFAALLMLRSAGALRHRASWLSARRPVVFSPATRRFSTGAATDAGLKQAAAAAAFTEWHASDLSARLKGKCSEPTTTNAALLRTADAFTLQHAELHTCQVGQITAEQTRKTFLSPVGQLHFEWACCHSMMPMELPLRWHCRLLLRRAADWRPDSTDLEWPCDDVSELVAGEMEPSQPGARAAPTTRCSDPRGLAGLLEAMEEVAAVGDAAATPLSRRKLTWLLAFLCAEPSDYCFDFFSGTLEAHEGEIE